MRKVLVYLITVGAIFALAAVCTVFARGDANVELLNGFGWEVDEKYIEKSELVIPEEFDSVYENYNKIQRDAGFDLEMYKGKRAVRYTYIVKNYPGADGSDNVRADVICVGGKPVGGDIMTVRLDGFMSSLIYPTDSQ